MNVQLILTVGFVCGCFALGNATLLDFPSKDSRIVGGTESVPGEFPWMAHLTIARMGMQRECGGSLISQNWIMTAAHCMDGAESVTVVLGGHNLNINNADTVTLQSKEFYIHPKYSSQTFPDDIALIKLPVNVVFTARIRSVVLADLGNRDHVNDTVIVSGWGYYSDAVESTSDVLLKASTTVISNEKCSETWGSIIASTMICTNGTRGGICKGDSGGPMVYSVDGTWVQIGIASFGDNLCELMKPKGFTRVQSYLNWIASITGVSVATTQRPTTTPFSCQSDGIKSNPYDCNSFYMCSNGTPYLFNCPGGLVFNPQPQQCDYRQNVPRCNY
ncbi:brachyurin-like isoform X1 [Daphnia pulex]|uniref:brachyurin-like isoform X1 n=2 Tax=Daphnia pulex TaxID=6669 RepID=UPI001EDD7805|nr:brachyurin-like isoform X1 [Daphnia pulex]